MKRTIQILIIGVLFMGTANLFGQEKKSEKFKVYGNCGMCETRIEKAAESVGGVITADWDKESKMITVRFGGEKATLDDIHQAIADVGHDTEKVEAEDKVYEGLPTCCHYDRPEKNK